MKFKKIKIRDIHDLKLGDIVFSLRTKKPLMVVKKDNTILHDHPFVILIDFEGDFIRAYADQFRDGEEILRLEWEKKKSK